MKNGDILTLDIKETNIMANGVAKHGNMVVFCKGAVAGDKVRAEITDVKKNYAEARIIDIESYSAKRIDPVCPYSDKCGGCSLSHVTYNHELSVKKIGVEASFRRCGAFSENISETVYGKELGYRNKAVFRFDGNKNIGFYAKGTKDFVEIDKCLLCDDTINIIMKKARELLQSENNIDAKHLTYLYIRYMKTTDEASVAIGYKGSDGLTSFANKLSAAMPQIKCIMRGKEDNPESRKEKLTLIWGNEHINEVFCSLKMKVSPASFFQVNHDVAERLCETVAGLDSLKENEAFLDLYCGTGIIGLTVARKYPKARVIGIEINPKAIRNAKENAKLNQITNAEFFCGDSSELEKALTDKISCVTVDPPRAGLSEKTVNELIRLSPERIIYVSCNPSTMSRDIKKMLGKYSINKAVAVDLFPRTLHVETVVILSQQKPDDYVEVELELDELDVMSAESKATYAEINKRRI